MRIGYYTDGAFIDGIDIVRPISNECRRCQLLKELGGKCEGKYTTGCLGFKEVNKANENEGK